MKRSYIVKKLICFVLAIGMIIPQTVLAFATEDPVTVTLDANGGQCSTETIEVTDNYGELPTPVRPYMNEAELDGIFKQPYGENDPDYIYYDNDTQSGSDTFISFYQKSGVTQFTNVQRIITVDVTQSGDKVYVYMTYDYLFTYESGTNSKYCVVSRKYCVLSGVAVGNDSPVTAYISYFPFYQQDNTGNNDGRANFDSYSNSVGIKNSEGRQLIFGGKTDNIYICNTSDVDIKIYLVKEQPYIKEAEYDSALEKWVPKKDGNEKFIFKKMALSENDVLDKDNDGINESAIDYFGKYQYLCDYENDYRVQITEVHSNGFDACYYEQLYSNCAYNIATGEKISSLRSYYTVLIDPLRGVDCSNMLLPPLGEYVFTGWFTEKIGGTKVESNSQLISQEDHTLYAHWKKLEANGKLGDDIVWALADGVLTITGEGSISATSFPWCAYSNYIESIVISEGITDIGDKAFYGCKNLTDVTIPESVKTIGEESFYQCSLLPQITFPQSLESIGEQAFAYCSRLNNLTIPRGLTYLDDAAFGLCTSLKKVVYEAEKCSVSSSAYKFSPFAVCFIEEIYIGENVKGIPDYIFSNILSQNNKTLNIYYPNNSIAIGENSFYFNSYYDEDIGTINSNEYREVDYENIVLPVSASKNLHYVYEGSKTYFTAIEENWDYAIYSGKDTASYIVKGGVLKSYDGSVSNIVIPSCITQISASAFENNEVIKSVEIPYSVNVIGNSAFAGCKSLSSVIIPFTVTSIGKDAFTNTKAKILCYYNSYAYKYAKENKLSYQLITISFAEDEVYLDLGDQQLLTASPSVDISCGIPITFRSTDSTVVTVDNYGRVRARNCGTADIEAYSDANILLGRCLITVAHKHADLNHDGVCDRCCVITNKTAKTADYIITNTTEKTVYKYSVVKMSATAQLPVGYELAWYVGNVRVYGQTTSNTGAYFETDEITENERYVLKIEKDGVVVDNAPTKEVTIKMNTNPFSALVGFFRRLFKLNSIKL